MLTLFSLKGAKNDDQSLNKSQPSAARENDDQRSFESLSSTAGSSSSNTDRQQNRRVNGKALDKINKRKAELARVQQSWANGKYFLMGSNGHEWDCLCCMKPQPMQQSLEEIDFDRGLWGAVVRGDTDRLQSLLGRDRDPNEVDSSGYAALHYAARAGKADMCSLLLQHQADVDIRAGEGRATPLHRACTAGAQDVVHVLLAWKASPGAVDADGQIPLQKALNGEHEAVAAILRSVPKVEDSGLEAVGVGGLR